MENRHPNWEHVFSATERAGKSQIEDMADDNLVGVGDNQVEERIRDLRRSMMCQVNQGLLAHVHRRRLALVSHADQVYRDR